MLSIGRSILREGSRDRTRMKLYARHLSGLHIVVLTRRSHGFDRVVHEENLFLYPTNSRTRLGMLVDAFRIAYRLLKMKRGTVTLTSQDPLELGVLSRILSYCARAPYTVQVHGDYYSPYWAGGSLLLWFRRLLIPLALKRAEKIRVVSERVARALTLRGIARERLTILPIRPELELFLNAVRVRNKKETFTVLTASRFSREKNIPLLIRAFARFHGQYPDTALRIIGEGGDRDRIEEAVRTLGLTAAVTTAPWTDHIETEMANADVFALASFHESYGLVLLESLAAGTPVVTTDVGCVGEVVTDGVHGIVVPVNNEQSFTDGLVRMYNDVALRTRAGVSGRALGKKCAAINEHAYAEEWVVAHSAL